MTEGVNHVERARQLEELIASPGWALCKDALGRQQVALMKMLSADRDVSVRELDRMRGIIFAVDHLLGMPERLLSIEIDEQRLKEAHELGSDTE